MSTTLSRPALGFAAGFLSHLVFQGALGVTLHAAGLLPGLPWSLEPVPPFDVPKTLSLGFWAGLWGLGYALVERPLTARLGWLVGGLALGLPALLVWWFVSLPLAGAGVAGGFEPVALLIHVAFHAIFGVGTAILFRAAQPLARRPGRAPLLSPRG